MKEFPTLFVTPSGDYRDAERQLEQSQSSAPTDSIHNRIAIQQTEELRAVYQTQLDALKSGRRWYDDVERMERKPRFF